MHRTSEPASSTALSGLAQGFWLGVAAILLCTAVLVLALRITQRCCCMAHRTSAADSFASDGGGKAVSEGAGEVKWNVDSTALKRTAPPVGSSDAIGPAPPAPAQPALATTLSTLPDASTSLESAPLRDAFFPSYGASEAPRRLSHPYNVSNSEAAVPPAPPQDTGSSHVSLLTRYHKSVGAPSLPQLGAAQDADELEEKYAGDVAAQQTLAPRQHALPDTSDDAPDAAGEGKVRATPLPPSAPDVLPSLPPLSSQANGVSGDSTAAVMNAHHSKPKNGSCHTSPRAVVMAEHNEEDGGEAATTPQGRLQAVRHAHCEELERAQDELRAALVAKEEAEAARLRITEEVRDMERYKGTLDGIIAFTLRELEDAAGGVEEAEAQMRRESTLALQNVLAAQESLRQTPLETGL